MEKVMIVLSIALVALIATTIWVILWRLAQKKSFPFLILLFLILPVGQLFMLYSFKFETWTVFWLAGVVLNLLADLLLLIYTISQERKTEAEEELKEAQHRMEMERAHYEAVSERREKLSEIRLDFNNRLETVARLVDEGKDGAAREMVAALAAQINKTSASPFCGIPVVNAVLAEKEKACEEASIGLSVELNIPDELAVSPMHLCSIFSNILDNAIAASRGLQEKSKPIIRLSSLVDGDYLFIKATNPSEKPKSKPAPGRGYGLRILAELARRYGGGFQSDYSDGIFTAVISLMAAGPPVEA